MENILVSFDTAKLAKEKGFNIKCNKFFIEKTKGETINEFHKENYGDEKIDVKNINRPAQSLLQRWLREVHNMNIFMSFKPNIKKWDFIVYSMSLNAKEYIIHNKKYRLTNPNRRFNSYEEALEGGLVEALKLIQ